MRLLLTFLISLVLFAGLFVNAAPLPTLEVVEARGGKQSCVGKACKVVSAVLCCGAHTHGGGGGEDMTTKDRRKKYGDPRFHKSPSPDYHDTKSHLSPPSPGYGRGPRTASATTQTFKKENYSGFKNALAKEKKISPIASPLKTSPVKTSPAKSPPHPFGPATKLHAIAEGKKPKKPTPGHSPSTSYALSPDRRGEESLLAFKRDIFMTIAKGSLLGKRVFTKGCTSAVCKDVATTGGSLRSGAGKYSTPNYTGKYLADRKQKAKVESKEQAETPFHSASSSPLHSPDHNPTMATYGKPPNHHLDQSKYKGLNPQAAKLTLERIDKAREDRHAQQFRTVRPEPKKSLGAKVKTAIKNIAKPAPHHHHRRGEESLHERGQCGSAFCSDVTGNKLLKGTSKVAMQSTKLGDYMAAQKKQRAGNEASTSHSTRVSLAGSDSGGSFHSIDLNSPHQSPPRHSVKQAGESSHRKVLSSPPKSQQMTGNTRGVKKNHKREEADEEIRSMELRGNTPSSSTQLPGAGPSRHALKPEQREKPAEYHNKSPQDLHHDHHHQCLKTALASSPLVSQRRPLRGPLRWPSIQRAVRERSDDDLVARADC